MKVKLAAQTLTGCALQFVAKCIPERLQSPDKTAKFCKIFNDAFDILNVRTMYPEPSNCNLHLPLTDENVEHLKESAHNIISYIKEITDHKLQPILESERKIGFLGFIICLTNIFDLFTLLKEKGLKYMLIYKLSQDHLETFFSALKSRGRFNNNLSTRQLEYSYKRLLIHHQINAAESGNCLINDVQILFVSSINKSDRLFDDDYSHADLPTQTSIDPLFDHDYLSTLWTLSQYVDEVIKYVSGFVIKKIKSVKVRCVKYVNLY